MDVITYQSIWWLTEIAGVCNPVGIADVHLVSKSRTNASVVICSFSMARDNILENKKWDD